MNTKIRELATQAFDHCCETYKDSDGPVPWVWEEKFGELVVEECLKVLDPSDDLTSMNEEYGRLAAMQMIKKHFGIK
jgi:hypothetical protein